MNFPDNISQHIPDSVESLWVDLLQWIINCLSDLVECELVSSLSLHSNVRFLRILRSTECVRECICILRNGFCIWLWWALTLLVNDWSLSVKHVHRVLDASLWALDPNHLRGLSVRQSNHLVRDQVPFEWVSICARAGIAVIVLVSFWVENLSDPDTRVVCCLAYGHLINPAECLSVTLLRIRNGLPIGNFTWLNRW